MAGRKASLKYGRVADVAVNLALDRTDCNNGVSQCTDRNISKWVTLYNNDTENEINLLFQIYWEHTLTYDEQRKWF